MNHRLRWQDVDLKRKIVSVTMHSFIIITAMKRDVISVSTLQRPKREKEIPVNDEVCQAFLMERKYQEGCDKKRWTG